MREIQAGAGEGEARGRSGSAKKVGAGALVAMVVCCLGHTLLLTGGLAALAATAGAMKGAGAVLLVGLAGVAAVAGFVGTLAWRRHFRPELNGCCGAHRHLRSRVDRVHQ